VTNIRHDDNATRVSETVPIKFPQCRDHVNRKKTDCVQVVREGVQVKLLPQGKEWYVLAQSHDRVNKERAIRRRQLQGLTKRLKELRAMALSRDQLLLKLPPQSPPRITPKGQLLEE
jgi:hypothetical protein